MTTYGSTGYFISLSTGIAGSYPVRYPTGDTILLWAESWENPRDNKDKMKEMANNGSYNNRMGKMARNMELRKCIIIDDDGEATTNTESYNNKITLLDSWCGITKSAVYLIICPPMDNPGFAQPNENRTINVALSRKGVDTPVDYMKGTIKRVPTKARGGHYLIDISMKETNLY